MWWFSQPFHLLEISLGYSSLLLVNCLKPQTPRSSSNNAFSTLSQGRFRARFPTPPPHLPFTPIPSYPLSPFHFHSPSLPRLYPNPSFITQNSQIRDCLINSEHQIVLRRKIFPPPSICTASFQPRLCTHHPRCSNHVFVQTTSRHLPNSCISNLLCLRDHSYSLVVRTGQKRDC